MGNNSDNPMDASHDEASVDARTAVNRQNKCGMFVATLPGERTKWRKAVQDLGFLDTQTGDTGNIKHVRKLIGQRDQLTNPLRCLRTQASRDAEYNPGRTWNRIILPSFHVSFASDVAEKRYLHFVSNQLHGPLLLLNGIGALVKSILVVLLAVRFSVREDWTAAALLTVLMTAQLLLCVATRFTADASKLSVATWFLLMADVLTPFALQHASEVSETYAMCHMLSMIFITYTLIATTLKTGLRMAVIASSLYLVARVMLMATSLPIDGVVAARKVRSRV